MEATQLIQCIITEKQSIEIKLTHFEDTRKRTHDLQIVRAEGNLKLSYDKHQAPTNGLKLYVRAVIESEAWHTMVQLKRKP